MEFLQIAKSFVKPGHASVIMQKIATKLLERTSEDEKTRNRLWLENACEEFLPLALRLDASLWNETESFQKNLHSRAQQLLGQVDVNLGGGGHYPLLYFITRYFKPDVVVETGVSAGFSTQSFLKAMDANNSGHVYSSDFPFSRFKNPEQYIGMLVEPHLKKRWELYVKGDRDNLPKMIDQVSNIDIFHYDSNKSYSGRRFAMSLIEQSLTDDAIIVMDDIQDNLFFHDYVQKIDRPWKVFKFEGKYLGLIGIS